MSDRMDAAIYAGISGALQVERLFGKSMEELDLEYKPQDGDTLRTIIDRYSGDSILSYLKLKFPQDGFDEEETGVHAGSESRKWYIDPFDGTSNLPIALPLSTVGLAFQQDSELILGVAIDPFNHKVYAAEHGSGAYEVPYARSGSENDFVLGEPKRIRVSARSEPKARYAEVDAFFNPKTSETKSGFLRDLHHYAQNVRMNGSNIRSGIDLASGITDIWLIDAVGGFFDIAPGYVLIKEAGGEMTDIFGNVPLPGVQVAIATNNIGDHENIRQLAHKHYQGYNGFR